MAAKRDLKIELPSLDDIFTTQEQRDDARLKRIYEIPISQIDDFPDHPFKVIEDEDMMNLVESIRENGMITPAVVRKKEDGRYELLSGHRRKRACELIGAEVMRCEVVEMSRDESVIFMVDSNLQRTKILPSEKAFSYKMRLDAMKSQGKRYDLTCAPGEHKSMKSRDKLAAEVGESREQVRRYIRLTELIPELLELVDKESIALRPAVELSYLSKSIQKILHNIIEIEMCTPSHAQAIRLRKLSDNNQLDREKLFEIMREEKPNQKERIVIPVERVRRYIPKEIPLSKHQEYIIKALEFYGRREKSKDKTR